MLIEHAFVVWDTCRFNVDNSTVKSRYFHHFRVFKQYLTKRCFLQFLERLKLIKDPAGYKLVTHALNHFATLLGNNVGKEK